jgi:hypothetical protein
MLNILAGIRSTSQEFLTKTIRKVKITYGTLLYREFSLSLSSQNNFKKFISEPKMSKMILVNIAEMLYFGERQKHYWLTISSNHL